MFCALALGRLCGRFVILFVSAMMQQIGTMEKVTITVRIAKITSFTEIIIRNNNIYYYYY